MPMNPEDYPFPSIGTTLGPHPWEPKELKPLHYEVIRQYIQGKPIARISRNVKKYGVSISGWHIRRLIATQKGQEYASAYSALFHQGLAGLVEHGAEYTPEMILTELDIARNPLLEPRHRLNASQDYMDRFGPPKISRQETLQPPPTTVVVNLLPSQLSAFLAPPAPILAEYVTLELSSGDTEADGS